MPPQSQWSQLTSHERKRDAASLLPVLPHADSVSRYTWRGEAPPYYTEVRLRTNVTQRAGQLMPDPLYLSLWFPDFSGPAMLPHTLAVLNQFPFSTVRPGITYLAVQPVSWNEATVLERRFTPGIGAEEAITVAADFIHDDYAYVFDAHWDLWMPDEHGREWRLEPSLVKFIAQGEEFDDGAQEQTGHIQIDFGLDSPFLQETVELTDETQSKVRANVARLVEFTMKAEKNTRASGRLLWSESEENLAQKLIARLQRVQ